MHQYPELPSPAAARQLQRRLVAWFRQSQRELPWRNNRDPYRIWVSETMLQQTQVAAVIPYYERFLARFPTVAALAAAPEQEVLRLWEGLGYYRRARNLHRAAQLLVERFGDQLPRAASAWAQLPGIGRYTLGAILSQAFDERLPIIETNSARVLSRWFACAASTRSGAVQRWLWETAARLVPARGAGEFNQALMELGALVCTPTRPSCLLCPVANRCAARAKGLAEEIPPRSPAPAVTAIREVAVVVKKRNLVLLVQRPTSASRWANLWEFPHAEVQSGESDAAAAERLVRELTGLRAAVRQEAAIIRHGITRYTITLVGYLAQCRGGRFQSPFYARGRWTLPKQLAQFPLSSPQRKLAAMVLDGENCRARTARRS